MIIRSRFFSAELGTQHPRAFHGSIDKFESFRNVPGVSWDADNADDAGPIAD